jgi:tetratricopeptide (TPR) repeat protein
MVRAWPALVAIGSFGVLIGIRRVRKGLGAYAWFAIALLPVLGFVTFAFQDISTVADRYAYPAMLAVAFGVALLVKRMPAELQWVAGLVLGAGLGTLASTQAGTWSSNEALFTRVQSINPKSFKAEGNLGRIAYGAKRWDEAIAHYERALEFGPQRWIPHQMLGLSYAQKGDYAQAEQHFTKSLELRADNVGIEAMLGSVRLQMGKYEEAQAPFRHVLEVDPARGDVREWLATALLAEGKNEEAAKEFQEALKTRDTAELRKNLAQALTIGGDAKGAIEQLRSVLKAKPGWPDAEIDLAWLLATAPDDALRQPTEAMSLAVHAQTGEKVPSARFLDTLAAAEAATGRFEEAAKTAERAAKLIPADQKGYAERVEKRRQSYLSNKDWHDLVR